MPPNSHRTVAHVLLLSNYAPDKQFSMRRFAEQLKQGLTSEGMSVEIFLPPVWFGKLGAKPSGFGKWLGYLDKYLLCPFLLKRKLKTLPENLIVHVCDHSNAIYTKALADTAHLVTCHDLLAVRCALGEIPQNYPKWTGRQQQAMILRGLKRSRMIASVSKATLEDVSRLVGTAEKWTHCVPNSLDDDFIKEANRPFDSSPQQAPPIPQLSEDTRYVMHIGGEKWYKNRKAALKIYAKLREKDACLNLVIVGPRFSAAALEESGCEGAQDQIHTLSGISDETLRDLYKQAQMLLFPSLIEGFGWPILEAQACGCPVATLDIEPMRSLNALSELTIQADPLRDGYTDLIAVACEQYLKLPKEARAQRQQAIKQFAAAFSNRASAKAYIKLYRLA